MYTRAHIPVSAGAHYANARVHVRARNKFVKSQAATALGLHSAADSHCTLWGDAKTFSLIDTEFWYFKFCQGSRGRGVFHKRVPHLHVQSKFC